MQKRSRKGFTLAELLIVVAIIAVLVAIAVPLFVSSLNKAQTARDDANVRSLRSVAVTYLLTLEDKAGDTDEYDKLFTKDSVTGNVTLKSPLYAEATLDGKGNFTGLKFYTSGTHKEGVNGDVVTAAITQTNLTEAEVDPAVTP